MSSPPLDGIVDTEPNATQRQAIQQFSIGIRHLAHKPPKARRATAPYKTPDHWQSAFISTSDGATIHYTRTGGEKPALLLLHGLQAMGLTWLRTAQALEPHYDVIMPNFRGHGASSRVAGSFTVDRLIDDVIELIRALDLDRPFAVGHSMGADIAGRLATALPLLKQIIKERI